MHKKILNFEIFNNFFVDNQETLLYFFLYSSIADVKTFQKKENIPYQLTSMPIELKQLKRFNPNSD